MKFEGGKLTFIRTSDFGGQIRESEFEGTVEGDKIKGKFKSEGRNGMPMPPASAPQNRNRPRPSRTSRNPKSRMPAKRPTLKKTGCTKT